MIGIATNVFLARAFGPATKGEYTAIAILFATAVSIHSFGLGPALARIRAESEAGPDIGISFVAALALLAGGCSAVLMLLFSPLVASWLQTTPEVIVVAALALPPALCSMFLGYQLVGAGHMLGYGAISICGGLARLASFVVAARGKSRLDATGVALALLIGELVGLVMAVYRRLAENRSTCTWRAAAERLTKEWRFAAHAYLFFVATFLAQRIDFMNVSSLFGIEALGIYSAAQNLADLSVRVSNYASLAMFSYSLGIRDRTGIVAVASMCRWLAFLSAGLAIMISLNSASVVRAMFGARFEEAAEILPLLASAAVLSAAGGVISSYLMGTNRAASVLVVSFVHLVLVSAFSRVWVSIDLQTYAT